MKYLALHIYLTGGHKTISSLTHRHRSLAQHLVLHIPCTWKGASDEIGKDLQYGARHFFYLKSFAVIGSVDEFNCLTASHMDDLGWLPRGCTIVLEGDLDNMMREEAEIQARDLGSKLIIYPTGLCDPECNYQKWLFPRCH